MSAASGIGQSTVGNLGCDRSDRLRAVYGGEARITCGQLHVVVGDEIEKAIHSLIARNLTYSNSTVSYTVICLYDLKNYMK